VPTIVSIAAAAFRVGARGCADLETQEGGKASLEYLRVLGRPIGSPDPAPAPPETMWVRTREVQMAAASLPIIPAYGQHRRSARRLPAA